MCTDELIVFVTVLSTQWSWSLLLCKMRMHILALMSRCEDVSRRVWCSRQCLIVSSADVVWPLLCVKLFQLLRLLIWISTLQHCDTNSRSGDDNDNLVLRYKTALFVFLFIFWTSTLNLISLHYLKRWTMWRRSDRDELRQLNRWWKNEY